MKTVHVLSPQAFEAHFYQVVVTHAGNTRHWRREVQGQQGTGDDTMDRLTFVRAELLKERARQRSKGK